jgi:hypothetical protein
VFLNFCNKLNCCSSLTNSSCCAFSSAAFFIASAFASASITNCFLLISSSAIFFFSLAILFSSAKICLLRVFNSLCVVLCWFALVAAILLTAAIAFASFARSNIENLDKEANAIAAVNRIAATRANQQRTTRRELNTLNKQILAEEKRIANEKKKIADEEIKRKQLVIDADAKALAIKKAADEKAQQEELVREEQQFNLLQKLRNTAQEQELFELTQQYEKKFELAEGNIELEKALEIQRNIDLAEIEDKYANEAKIKRDAINKKDAEDAQRLQDLKTDAVLTGLNTISSLTQTFAGESVEQQKKAFNINKAVGIASTLVQTFQSAQGAYLSQLSIPSPDAPIRANIAAGIATATGLANVAAIAAQKFKAPSKQKPSKEEGGGLTSPTQPPSFNVVGASGFNQVAGVLGQQQPLQAFVVAGDVTTAQQLQNNTVQQATF